MVYGYAFNYNPDANISAIPTVNIYQGGYIFQINDDGTGLVAESRFRRYKLVGYYGWSRKFLCTRLR